LKVLLDTHVFIWMLNDADRISQNALGLLKDSENEVILSVASLWEILIKESLGKIKFHEPVEVIFEKAISTIELRIIPIEAAHVFELRKLPLHHKDPFDRILTAQAAYENAYIMTSDRLFDNYPVKTIW